MDGIKYKYTIIDRRPISDEIWENLNHNNELVEAGFLQSEFKELIVETVDAGMIEVYAHDSILEKNEQLEYIVQCGIVSKLDTLKNEKETTN